MWQVNVKQLYDDNCRALQLTRLGAQGDGMSVRRDAAVAASLIGHLNLTHPNSIQVLGRLEADFVGGENSEARREFVAKLLAGNPCAVILADGLVPSDELIDGAGTSRAALFTTPLPAPGVIETLARYLAKALAESTTRHGVLMDVLGLGVLITGESGVGKSELGLELISRGHGLVADDVVELSRIATKTLEGRCPPLLRDFLEVRGLGVLNIRTIFGQTAVRPKMRLKLIVHLEKPMEGREAERLPLAELAEDILGVTVRKVILPVAAGRNLAVLLEAAVRNYILQLRGFDSTAEFVARQKGEIGRGV
jgi:HPr kinase/phosphorylase